MKQLELKNKKCSWEYNIIRCYGKEKHFFVILNFKLKSVVRSIQIIPIKKNVHSKMFNRDLYKWDMYTKCCGLNL